MVTKQPLVGIVGPTASGKSDVAMRLAKDFGGEIICADSRTIYKGMDIGTAKPSYDDQKRIKHHLLDVAEPGDRFTVVDFQKLAKEAIDDIRSRGKLPLLVGGSGLYVDSVIYNFDFKIDYDPKQRKQLEAMSIEELHKYSKINNIKLPENSKNKRYVVRNIERKGAVVRSNNDILSTSIIVGIATEKDELIKRITQRTEHIFESGVANEARKLGEIYGWNSEAMTGNIYPILRKYLLGEISMDEAKEQFISADKKLAKRQMTWFKRNKNIHWCSNDEAYTYIAQELVKTRQK